MKALLILNIILSINILFLLGAMIKFLKTIDKSDDEESNKSIDNDKKYNIYSLEFNTLLDDKIRPMIGKYKNEDIARHLTEELITNVDTDYYDLKDHISGVLLNYNNTFEEEYDKGEGFDLAHKLSEYDEYLEYMEEQERKSKIADSSDQLDERLNKTLVELTKKTHEFTNIANNLNSFYKD